MTKGQNRDWARLALFFGCNVLFAAGLFSHALLYNFYLDGLGAGEATMGGAAAALTAGGLAALIPAGQLVDRLGARRTWTAGAVLAATGLVLGAWAASRSGIWAAAFIAGAGTSSWRVAMGPMIMRLSTPASRARAFSWNVALLLGSGAVWTAVSGAIPGWLEQGLGLGRQGGIRVGLVAGAAATLSSALLLLLLRTGREDRGDTGRPHASAAVEPGDVQRSAAAGTIGWRARLDELRDRVGVPADLAILVIIVALWMTAGGLVIPFFNLYFLREHGMQVGRIGLLFGITQAITALAVFVSGDLAARTGARRTLLAWALPFGPLLWVMGVAPSIAAATVLYVLQGFVPPATNPLIDQLLLERAPAGRQGAVSTWRNAATEMSGLVGASAGGALLQATSFRALFTVAGVIAFAGAIALALALRRSHAATTHEAVV